MEWLHLLILYSTWRQSLRPLGSFVHPGCNRCFLCVPPNPSPVCSWAFKGHVWRGLVQQPFSGECGWNPHPSRFAQCRAAQSTSHRFYQQASIEREREGGEISSDKFLLPFLFTSPECLPFYLLAIGAVSWDSWAVKMERTGIASM